MSIDAIESQSRTMRTTVTPVPKVHLAPEYSIGSMIGAAIVASLLVALGFIVARNPYFRWPVFGEYFFSEPILYGIRMTLILTAITMAIATVLGVLIAVMRLSRNPVLMAGGFFLLLAPAGHTGPCAIGFLVRFRVALQVSRIPDRQFRLHHSDQ